MIEKIKFSDLDEKIKINRCSILFLVSSEKNPDNETDDQFENILEKINLLPEEIKDKFFSYAIGSKILEVGEKFGLQLLQIADISRAIRSYYFGELKLEDFPFTLAKEMNIDLAKARQIFQVIKERIIDDDSYEKAAQASLINLPLSEALRIYPEVGEQLVTSSKISLRNFPYPVRPSIKNWLADYTFNLGYEKHESMARSQYLFQGANAKNLPDPEKQKLSYLLKSFDENSPIAVNKRMKQVVFSTSNARNIASADKPVNENNLPKNLTDQFRPAAVPKEEQKNINALRFSYRQKMPYEKNLAPAAPALPVKIPAENRDIQPVSRDKSDLWKISNEKTPAAAPAKNPPPNTPIKSSPWRLPEEKTFAPAAPVKNLPPNAPNKSDLWRLPGYPTTPQGSTKNVVDLKNINQ
ncbi:MAG: hypothetical protein COS71_00645 [Candidatus Moranbacteria bacterium CG06_land_8_20_14_3_00_40_12]|nr:MAG: hypothetical protein COS71_00645 [Candidatus Moranbacteria bacterium CG06_land_8_20_14_3_00_40_12]